MRESTFNSELLHSLKEQGAWAYKIPDHPTSWTSHATRFTPDKPCDIVGMYKGVGFIIEGKQIKKFEAFGINSLRPSQIMNLDEAVNKGNRAFVFLNIRIKAEKGKVKHENRCLMFDWKIWRDRFKESSIKGKELPDIPYVEGKGSKDSGIRYNLAGFLGDIYGQAAR